MRRTGLMGGTFDPIHLGHLLAADAAREAANLAEVWFVPTSVPAHKPQPGASGAERREMVETAIRGIPYFRVETSELNREGVSYTIDTVTELQNAHPDREFYWIVGADMRNSLPTWRRIEELARRVSFICLERPGEPDDAAVLPAFLQPKLLRAAMPPIGISSTDIRGRRREGRSIRFMVPEAVREYIERKGLYES
ncbi:nicotinate-nucleotide adenylyltransferase [Cohnella nanjingensis]|uniref:Probable nicotinate-nucleotide adenylyltransferase n=1 Tax=Cohnella nanjingensis TaxID=1387779 RepID=A0A7X0RUH0_9BACL|nr:nicotinate-nucleotide adenylyltransferase [Cohnella nanjingensis]MBB6673938.1 nicotinate-nucleotide adenylyltransferase [Cohnella nanjingensis]